MSNLPDTENWTQIITSKNKWYDINLKEIWDYRDLIGIFVKRNVTTIYKQTILGPIWFLFGPLFTVFTYTFVFNEIAKIPTDGIPAPVFYLAGTTLWNYFDSCFNGASYTFTANAGIFGKVYFPRLIPAISLVISNLLKTGIQLLTFIIFCIYYYSKGQIHPNEYLFLFPFLLILMSVLSLGIGIIISSLTTKYRDVNQFIGVIITLLMYASPIIYPTSSVPDVYKPFVAINPIVPIIDAFRFGFTGAGAIDFGGLIYSVIFSIITLIFGLIIFNKVEKNFIDTI